MLIAQVRVSQPVVTVLDSKMTPVHVTVPTTCMVANVHAGIVLKSRPLDRKLGAKVFFINSLFI